MNSHKNVFVCHEVKKPNKFINKLKSGKLVTGLFLVVINKNDKLEIYNSYTFFQKTFRNMDFTLVALFKNMSDALEYIRKITELSFKKYDSFLPVKCIDELELSDFDFLYSESGEDSE